MDGLNTRPVAVKVEKGIKVIVTPEFRGIVCQCGCTDNKRFNQFISKTVSKDISGNWTKGEKFYVRCDNCGTVEDWEAFKEDCKKLTDPTEKQAKKESKKKVKVVKKAKLDYINMDKDGNLEAVVSNKEYEKPKRKRKVGRPRKK